MPKQTRRKMPKPNRFDWEDALDLYVTHLQAKRASARTLKSYPLEVHYLRDHLAKGASLPEPGAVTLQHLRDYQCGLLTGEATRRGKPILAATVARTSTILRGFFKFLSEEGKILADPAVRLESPKAPRNMPGEVLTVKETRKLLKAPQTTTPLGLRDRALVEVMYATGLRKHEVRALDLGDVNHDEREVIVRHGKGDKGRIVPIAPSAYAALCDYLDRARPVIATKHPDSLSAVFLANRGRRMSETAIRDVLNRLAAWAGITKRVKPHMMRRTFATHLMEGGANLRLIQTLMGHESLDTTAIYLRLNSKELRREVIRHHPRERFDV